MSAISANALMPACAQILLIMCCWYETAVYSKSALISLFLASMWEVFFCSSSSCNLACSSFIFLSFTPNISFALSLPYFVTETAYRATDGHRTHKPWASDEQALGIEWTSLGHQMNKPWASSEQALGIEWTSLGHKLPKRRLVFYVMNLTFICFFNHFSLLYASNSTHKIHTFASFLFSFWLNPKLDKSSMFIVSIIYLLTWQKY